MSYHIQLDQIGATYIANSAMHTQAKPAHRREAPKFDHAPFGMPNGTLDRVSRGRKLSVCRRGLAYVSHRRRRAHLPSSAPTNRSPQALRPARDCARAPGESVSIRAWSSPLPDRQTSTRFVDLARRCASGCLRDTGSPEDGKTSPRALTRARREGPRSARRRRRDGSGSP